MNLIDRSMGFVVRHCNIHTSTAVLVNIIHITPFFHLYNVIFCVKYFVTDARKYVGLLLVVAYENCPNAHKIYFSLSKGKGKREKKPVGVRAHVDTCTGRSARKLFFFSGCARRSLEVTH